MSTSRDSLDTVRIICRRPDRRRARKCYACNREAKVLCDHPKEPEPFINDENLAEIRDQDPDFAERLTTCSRPCCGAHGCWWTGQKHLCKEHAQERGIWA